MGRRGCEAARAAAGIILLEDDLHALVDRIAEGRRIFANIQGAFLFLIGFKAMVVSLALLAPALDLPVLLLVEQLVWLELIVHPRCSKTSPRHPIRCSGRRARPLRCWCNADPR